MDAAIVRFIHTLHQTAHIALILNDAETKMGRPKGLPISYLAAKHHARVNVCLIFLEVDIIADTDILAFNINILRS